MPITRTQRVAYGLFARMIVVLLLGAAAYLLARADALAGALLHLALLAGLVGGGLVLVADEHPTSDLRGAAWLPWSLRAVDALALIVAVLGLAGQLDTGWQVPIPAALDALIGGGLALLLAFIAIQRPQTAFLRLWWVAMALVAATHLLELSAVTWLRRVAQAGQYHIGLVVAGVALAFWLMTRFSHAPRAWAQMGVVNVGGLLALAGAIISLAPLAHLALVAGPLAVAIAAAHSHRALSDPNGNRTLAAYWVGSGMVLLIVGIGVVAAFSAPPGVQRWVSATHLPDLQYRLVSLAVLAFVLGMVNHSVAALRGSNQRITGLLPFWLVTFGALGWALAHGLAGTVQLYLVGMLGLPADEVRALLVPLHSAAWVGWLALTMGLVIYALGFWARSVKVRDA